MRTLYFRIVLTFVLVSMASGLIALLATNLYYQAQLKEDSDNKILGIAKEIRTLYERMPGMDLDTYMTHIANTGFQLFVVNSQMEGSAYGREFKHKRIEAEQIRRVLEGETYNGIVTERRFFILSYFDNSLHNSVGLPISVQGERYALFVRPNLEQQIGEVRIIMAILLGVTFLCSSALIVVLSRYIVRPVKHLTRATHQIVGGQYDVELNVSREDEIGNLARDFTRMAQSLKQLDAMRQEFVANVSHEIQSPLTSIQGFAQTMLDKEATPEEEEQYLRIIGDESRRLSSLSKQLLTLAALDKEDNLMKRTAFRLDEQIRQVLIVTEWQWSDKQLHIEPELSEIVISADQQLLYQVWMNVITNSIKFSRPGGTVRIELTVGQEITVTVADTGIGISEADLPHIFERFYKADKSRSASRSGSGLGLSIAKKIVELHQGDISVRSKPGEGTTVQIRLPY